MRTEVATEPLHGSLSVAADAALANPSGILKGKPPKKARGVRGVTRMVTADWFMLTTCPRCEREHLLSARCQARTCIKLGLQTAVPNASADAVEAEYRAMRRHDMEERSKAFWASKAGEARSKQIAEKGEAARFWVG